MHPSQVRRSTPLASPSSSAVQSPYTKPSVAPASKSPRQPAAMTPGTPTAYSPMVKAPRSVGQPLSTAPVSVRPADDDEDDALSPLELCRLGKELVHEILQKLSHLFQKQKQVGDRPALPAQRVRVIEDVRSLQRQTETLFARLHRVYARLETLEREQLTPEEVADFDYVAYLLAGEEEKKTDDAEESELEALREQNRTLAARDAALVRELRNAADGLRDVQWETKFSRQ